MANPGFQPIAIIGLIIFLTTLARTQHICSGKRSEYDVRIDDCDKIVIYNSNGYVVDGYDPNENYPDKYDEHDESTWRDRKCQFVKTFETNITECCRGWSGRDCTEPECNPACQNGGTCKEVSSNPSKPPGCVCVEPFSGVACEENQDILEKDKVMYCYNGNSCNGGLAKPSAVQQSDCCTGSFAGSWGSQNSSYKCVSCKPVPTEIVSDKATCISMGSKSYNTFSNVQFSYESECPVPMLITYNFKIYAVTECTLYDNCACGKITYVFTSHYTYIIRGAEITVISNDRFETINMKDTPRVTKAITEELNSKHDSDREATYHTFTNNKAEIRSLEFGMTTITVPRYSEMSGNVDGFCGKLTSDKSDDAYLTSQKGAESIVNRYKNSKIPCGIGLTVCNQDELPEATQKCAFLESVFNSYTNYINLQEALQRCQAVYCTVKKNGTIADAEKAVCHIGDQLSTEVKLKTDVYVAFRSEKRCAKECSGGKVFSNLITTRCHPTCGSTLQATLREDCKTPAYSGCTCPENTMRYGDSCVHPTKCPCIGNDKKEYQNGDVLNTPDRCETCKCTTYGVWECTQSTTLCTSKCTVVGHSLITSFDGKAISLVNAGGSYILVRGENITIKVNIEDPKTNAVGETSRPFSLIVTYEGRDYTVRVTTDGATITDGPNNDVTIRKLSYKMYNLDIAKKGIRMLFSHIGLVIVEINKLVYANKVEGYCGNSNGLVDDEKKILETNAILEQEQFDIKFSDSDLASSKDATLDYSSEQCDRLGDVARQHADKCDDQYWQNMCRHMASGSKDAAIWASSIYCDFDPNEISNTLPSKGPYTIHNVCNSSCIGYGQKNCQNAYFRDSGCDAGKVVARDGSCVAPTECGCVHPENKNLVFNNTQSVLVGCRKCTCYGYYTQCKSECEPIMCPEGHVSKQQLLTLPEDKQVRQTCKPAPNNFIRVNESAYTCFCGNGFKADENGICVKYCSCEENGRQVKHGEVVESGCKQKQCQDGKFFEFSGLTNDCTGICKIVGGVMSVVQFDKSEMVEVVVNNLCEIIAVQTSDITVTILGLSCTNDGKVCSYMLNAYSKYFGTIQFSYTERAAFYLNSIEYTSSIAGLELKQSTLYNVLMIRNQIALYIYPGAQVRIEVSLDLFEQTRGLCGVFSQKSDDDLLLPNGLKAVGISQLANSYLKDSENCPVNNEPLGPHDMTDKDRLEWAQKQCNLMFELEAFRECSKVLPGIQGHFDSCVSNLYFCSVGMDCDCSCTAYTVFAQTCKDYGIDLNWRHFRFCGAMCPPDGSQYTSSAPACDRVCGKTISNDSLCNNLYPSEGCACPDGFSRENDKTGAVCVPDDSCSCIYKDMEILSGQEMKINCQDCTCLGGNLECSGDPCKEECPPNQFRCSSGVCIDVDYRCNGKPECPGGDDEIGCEGKCNEFTCNNGQCVSNATVCNGVWDCIDKSDDENCRTYAYLILNN